MTTLSGMPAFDAVVFDWEGTLALPWSGPGGDDGVAGVAGLLEDLHALGVPLAIATGKSRRGLDAALAVRGWQTLFAETRCADDGPSKPHPWMLHDICGALDVDPTRVVMVGDTVADAGMAHAAGATAERGAQRTGDQAQRAEEDVAGAGL